MLFDFENLPSENRYKLLTATVTPRPIAWITTCSTKGEINAAPYSFFNVMGHTPPTVAIGLLPGAEGGFKDTAANILATGEFVVNLVSEEMAGAMNQTCVAAPHGVDELQLAGLEGIASEAVKPPRIAGAPVAMECRVLSSMVTGPAQTIVIGTVVRMHIDDRFVMDAERCHVDTPALNLIGRMHGSGWYTRSQDLFQLDRPVYQGR
jgi:flavin reductase (DIM6/NTAB) family NADH-FMN oxidoreductase RutF